MFKNRFLLVIGVVSLLLVGMAMSRPLSTDPKAADLSWPPRPVIAPVTGANDLSDYYERHRDQRAPVGIAVDRTDDYFMRHPELIAPAKAPLDECFDASIGELAACRSAVQTPAPGLACESPVDCR